MSTIKQSCTNEMYCYFQCLFSVRTTLKVCKLGERILEGSSTSSNGGGGGGSGSGYMNEESILDLGRAMYKLHLQLLLLLEAAAKMYITLSNSAGDGKVCRVTIGPTSIPFDEYVFTPKNVSHAIMWRVCEAQFIPTTPKARH